MGTASHRGVGAEGWARPEDDRGSCVVTGGVVPGAERSGNGVGGRCEWGPRERSRAKDRGVVDRKACCAG